ncbi:MAG: outer rane immunogenic protein [Methylobacteriaceae bacterium]|jgi:outer membrane immunogenic protein|nr:outer rane immunogenic protein [Methylobacteriaceae bacterium]
MQKLLRLISAGVFSACAAGAASAADLPSRQAPPPVPVVVASYAWTGCYVGAHAGFAYDDYHFATFAASPLGGSFSGRSKVYTSGPLGGGDIGCDYRLPWNIVIGVAADIDAAAIHGSVSASGPLAGGVGVGGIATSTRVNALGTVRGRIGYAFDRLFFTDNVLIYLTAGAAYGSIRDNFTGFAGPAFGTWTSSRHPFGAGKEPGAVGIGIEKMITPNLSVDLQYRYQYMGAATPTVALIPGGTARFGTRSMYHLGRIGLNYHFNWGGAAPVVARY